MSGSASAGMRRMGALVNTGAFLAAVITLAVVVCYFAYRPEGRLTFDATKTRAYSLSDRTTRLLETLEGRWTIALIMVEDDVDTATRRQVDEVLRRYADGSDAIDIVRVDPSDPETLVDYDTLLSRLRSTEQDLVDRYELNIRDAVATFSAFQEFAQDQVRRIEPLQPLAAGTSAESSLRQIMTLLGLVAGEGGKVLDLIDESMAVTDAQPIPGYEVARSILAGALTQWGDQVYDMANLLEGWRQDSALDPRLGAYAGRATGAFTALAQRLAEIADPLATLPELELAAVGRQLQRGEALVVIGPDRATVVPSEQLFPSVGVREVGAGSVAFDRRFRGEQIISSAIRSLQTAVMPMVVFVHAEPQSMLRTSERHTDLVGVMNVLKSARYAVGEWSVGTTERPVVPRDQPVVYCVVPPLRRASLEPEAREVALVRAVEDLVADGESILLSVNPSLLPRYRQPDPWQKVVQTFGLRPRTGDAVLEAAPLPDGTLELQATQLLSAFRGEHPICGALRGQTLALGLPVPLEIDPSAPDDRMTWTIAEVPPSPRRWIDPEWSVKIRAPAQVEPGAPITAPVPVIIAAERRHPLAAGRQRLVLVGSGGWLLSAVADAVMDIGGGRVVLNYPGNQELLLASSAWLAGIDDLIATSPVSQQVTRLDGIDGAASVRWAVIAVVLTPGACLLLSVVVAVGRRVMR